MYECGDTWGGLRDQIAGFLGGGGSVISRNLISEIITLKPAQASSL